MSDKKETALGQSDNSGLLAAGASMATNSLFVGLDAGIDVTSGDGLTIIGDGIRSLDRSQKDVIFVGYKAAIGREIMGRRNELYYTLKQHYNMVAS